MRPISPSPEAGVAGAEKPTGLRTGLRTALRTETSTPVSGPPVTWRVTSAPGACLEALVRPSWMIR